MDLNKPLPAQIYQYLKEKILDGKLDKDTLYSETKMAKELSVSRTPLRDALRYLEQDGYIEIVPSRGFRIRKLDQEGLRASIEIRCAIEGYCAYRVAEQFNTPQVRALLKKLEETIVGMEQCVEQCPDDPAQLNTFIDFDHAFHSHIITFANVEEFHTEFQRVRYLVRQTSKSALKVPGRSQETLEEHQRIFSCLRAGEAVNAYQAMLRHLRQPLYLVDT